MVLVRLWRSAGTRLDHTTQLAGEGGGCTLRWPILSPCTFAAPPNMLRLASSEVRSYLRAAERGRAAQRGAGPRTHRAARTRPPQRSYTSPRRCATRDSTVRREQSAERVCRGGPCGRADLLAAHELLVLAHVGPGGASATAARLPGVLTCSARDEEPFRARHRSPAATRFRFREQVAAMRGTRAVTSVMPRPVSASSRALATAYARSDAPGDSKADTTELTSTSVGRSSSWSAGRQAGR